MKVSVLGPGDLTKITRHTTISEKDLKNLINEIGKLLAEKDVELVIVPELLPTKPPT